MERRSSPLLQDLRDREVCGCADRKPKGLRGSGSLPSKGPEATKFQGNLFSFSMGSTKSISKAGLDDLEDQLGADAAPKPFNVFKGFHAG